MKVTITMNIINVFTSYTMIYGLKFKFLFMHINTKGYGVRGAALGLTTARLVGAVIVLFILLKGSKNIKLTDIFHIKINMDIQKSIFNIGIPASIESLLFNCGKLITQVLIVGMGTASIASNYIANSILSMVNIPGSSLTVAATTLVGQSMGRGDDKEAASNLKYLVSFAAVCLTVLSLISLPLAHTLASLYNKDTEIIRITVSLIRLSAIFTPVFWALSFVLPAGLKGAGDVKYTMFTSMFGMWVFRITLGYVLGVPLKIGVAGVWLGMFTDWVVRGTLYAFRFKNGKWKYKRVIKGEVKPVKPASA
jgi:putative MATE family efflux protein